MTPDIYINQTLSGWIMHYEIKKRQYRSKLNLLLVIDVLFVLIVAATYIMHVNLSLLRMIVIIFFITVILLFTTLRVSKSYRGFKILLKNLEYEKGLFLHKSSPYEVNDDQTFNLFIKRSKELISNSIPELSDMPEGFSYSV